MSATPSSCVGTVCPLTTALLCPFEVVVGVSFGVDVSWSYAAKILSKSAPESDGGLRILPEESKNVVRARASYGLE